MKSTIMQGDSTGNNCSHGSVIRVLLSVSLLLSSSKEHARSILGHRDKLVSSNSRSCFMFVSKSLWNALNRMTLICIVTLTSGAWRLVFSPHNFCSLESQIEKVRMTNGCHLTYSLEGVYDYQAENSQK